MGIIYIASWRVASAFQWFILSSFSKRIMLANRGWIVVTYAHHSAPIFILTQVSEPGGFSSKASLSCCQVLFAGRIDVGDEAH